MFLILLLIASLSFGMGIDEVLEKALEKSPLIKVIEEEVKVFEGMRISARAFPNPETRLESGFLTTTKDGKPEGKPLYLLEFNQPIPFWGVREKSEKVVLKEKESFENLVEARKREIIAQVYRDFYKSLYLKEIAKIWEENYKTAKEVEEFVRKSYELGEVTLLELLRAKREKQLAYIQYKVALSKYEASLKELSRLVGVQINDVEGNLRNYPSLKDINIEELPTVKSIRKKIESFERRIELEKSLAKPQVSVGFVVEESKGDYYGLRVSLTLKLPLFYRRQGEILQNSVLKSVFKKRLAAELLRIENRIHSIKIRLETLEKELKRLEDKVIPDAKEELSLAIKSYTNRVITLLELSDVRRRYYELLMTRAELLLNIHETYSEFIEIGGWKW